MKVKRLEIQGFKSFKDKTVLHFDEGVTGIVGPNGCGKSNIVDSFFWVMGEQSIKHMRADGQLDLIFNGSEKYSPLSMAEVTLVLSTGAKEKGAEIDDISFRDLPAHLKYDEISITRRLYRDGQSEFFINGQQCRLKDIHELFMDTGAGPKAYSIIEQGQIARIISAKPEDRRVLVEEAAGIVKFKARKKESQRKIEATQGNLNRINDIIAEIERNLNSLERQAHKARQYKVMKEELLGKEMLSGRKKLFGLKDRIAFAETKVQDLSVSEVEQRSALQTAELRIENLKIQTAEIQRLLEEEQFAFQNLQREISQEDTKLQIQKRKIQEVENSSMSLEEEAEELRSSIASSSSEKANIEAQLEELNALFETADQVLKDQQSKIEETKKNSDDLGQSLEQEKREMMASLSHRNDISNQVHGLEARVDALSVQINTLTYKIQDRESESQALSAKFDEAKSEHDTNAMKADVARTRVADLEHETAELEKNLKELRASDLTIREDLAKAESTQKALQDFVANHEGFKLDVQNILKDEAYAHRLKGVFAQTIEAHPGYEYALEAILRDFLENLFVESAEDAKALLQSLKNDQKGRVALWSSDLISRLQVATASSTEVLSRVPHARPLTEVVRIEHMQSEKILPILKNFFVVEDINEAVSAFEKCADLSVSFVTREGDIVDRYGRVIGGSTKALEGGFLARKAELQALAESLTILRERALIVTDQISATEETFGLRKSELAISSAELRDFDLKAKHAERDLASVDSQLMVSRRELERYQSEKTALDGERQAHWQKLDGIRIELSSLEDSTKNSEHSIETKTQAHAEALSQVAQLQAVLTQFKVDFASKQENLRHSKQNLERIQYQLTQDQDRLEEVERMINRKLDEKDLLAQELEVLETQVQELTLKAQSTEDHLRLKKNEYEKISLQMTESFEDQRSAMKLVDEISTELNTLKLDHEKCSLEYQMLYQSMFQKYGLEESGIAPQTAEEETQFSELTAEKELELKLEVDSLHEKIRKLGEVNVLAVEEFDAQKKRFDFLVTQREDLIRSIADLEKAIERINKTSEERFKIAFQEIDVRFQRIFPVVFGGGWAKLEMTNPADLNETGIDIIAEPPGKKVSSIQLMSGGEKALTAVALIFSIFLIKPSPFCVLDEVDAPLDDHNVGKFNALLKEMATRSQFIIITHNKRTMELNDKLYGVTMEEPGVSKMVSIQIQ